MLRFGGFRTTSKEGGGFLADLKTSNSFDVLFEVLDDCGEVLLVALCSLGIGGREGGPREVLRVLNREKVLVEAGSVALGVASSSGSGLRRDKVDGKFLILMMSVDIFLLGLGSSLLAPIIVVVALPAGVLKLDMVAVD